MLILTALARTEEYGHKQESARLAQVRKRSNEQKNVPLNNKGTGTRNLSQGRKPVNCASRKFLNKPFSGYFYDPIILPKAIIKIVYNSLEKRCRRQRVCVTDSSHLRIFLSEIHYKSAGIAERTPNPERQADEKSESSPSFYYNFILLPRSKIQPFCSPSSGRGEQVRI
jgi:hypothetical protein